MHPNSIFFMEIGKFMIHFFIVVILSISWISYLLRFVMSCFFANDLILLICPFISIICHAYVGISCYRGDFSLASCEKMILEVLIGFRKS